MEYELNASSVPNLNEIEQSAAEL